MVGLILVSSMRESNIHPWIPITKTWLVVFVRVCLVSLVLLLMHYLEIYASSIGFVIVSCTCGGKTMCMLMLNPMIKLGYTKGHEGFFPS